MLKEPYLSPVASFVCIRSIHPEGGFYNPKRLTSYHAKMQFSLRLLILAEAQNLYEAQSQGDGDSNAKYEDYMKSVPISLGKRLTDLHKIAMSEVSLHDGLQRTMCPHLPSFANGSVDLALSLVSLPHLRLYCGTRVIHPSASRIM